MSNQKTLSVIFLVSLLGAYPVLADQPVMTQSLAHGGIVVKAATDNQKGLSVTGGLATRVVATGANDVSSIYWVQGGFDVTGGNNILNASLDANAFAGAGTLARNRNGLGWYGGPDMQAAIGVSDLTGQPVGLIQAGGGAETGLYYRLKRAVFMFGAFGNIGGNGYNTAGVSYNSLGFQSGGIFRAAVDEKVFVSARAGYTLGALGPNLASGAANSTEAGLNFDLKPGERSTLVFDGGAKTVEIDGPTGSKVRGGQIMAGMAVAF